MRTRLTCSILAFSVLAALLTSGCGASITRVSSSSDALVPPAATARADIRWRQVTPPADVALQETTSSLAIAPADGHIAWICALIGTDRFAIWATSDAGTTWRQVSTLVPATQENPTSCVLHADVNDARALAAIFWWGCGACGTLAQVDYYSIDGGAHWSELASVVHSVAHGRSQTFAIVTEATPTSGPSAPPQLVASPDVLHTWHTITPGDAGAHDGVVVFAVAPETEELLAATQNDALWRSTDGGSTWSKLALTRTAQSPQDYGLHWLGGQGRWMICANGLDATYAYGCSMDLGQTWRAIHVPTYTIMCPTCGKGFPATGQVTACLVSGPTQDGLFLAACPTTIPIGTEPYQGTYTVYSLTLGAAQWKAVGIAPGMWLEAAGQGILWCRDAHNALYAAATS
jgi:photosystem II stability/assembly factor-like uncharacterized protein